MILWSFLLSSVCSLVSKRFHSKFSLNNSIGKPATQAIQILHRMQVGVQRNLSSQALHNRLLHQSNLLLLYQILVSNRIKKSFGIKLAWNLNVTFAVRDIVLVLGSTSCVIIVVVIIIIVIIIITITLILMINIPTTKTPPSLTRHRLSSMPVYSHS